MDWEAFVEQTFLASHGHQFDEILHCAGIELAAPEAWIHEGSKSDPGQVAGPVGGNVTEQLRNHSLREIVGFNLPSNGQSLQLGHETPMTANHPFDQTGITEMIETTILAITLASGIDQSQVPRLSHALRMRFFPG